MRILFLTPQLPYPPHQGTTIRNYNIIANLAPRHEIHLLSFVHSQDEIDAATPLHQHCRSIEGIPIPRRSPLKRFLSLFLSPLPDMALRLPSAEFQAKLAATLRRVPFDVVQIEGIEMTQFWMLEVGNWKLEVGGWKLDDGTGHPTSNSSTTLRTGFQPPTSNVQRPISIFDNHNAEYVLQQRAFETDVRQPRRWVAALYSLIQWKKLSRYEAMICQLADGVVAVSEADKAALQQLVPGLEVTVVPNAVDVEYYTSADIQPSPLPPRSLVFTGKMDFRPNVDAVLWFCHEVLPIVQRRIPDVCFYIVGQSPHRRVLRLADDPAVTVTGYVDDVRSYIAGACVYVVPLRIGGGTRLKVLEAMAMSRPIVSTSLGCEGFEGLVSGRELSLADTPEEFAQQVIELLDDASRRERLGWAARRFVEEQYDWWLIVPRLEQIYEAGRWRLEIGS
ncbi:MAG: glycosyltransferase [Anaerolineales bacterium]|nr:glycosyltransferase [Anaerolineales bacterium]